MRYYQQIIDSLHNIKDFLLENEDINDLSLGSGLSAKSLFLYNYSLYFQDDRVLDIAINNFETAYNDLENSLNNSGLINGSSGILWLYLYLGKHEVVNIDTEIIEFFDKFFIESIKVEKANSNYDLFYGFLGYAVYFLQKARMGLDENSNDLKFIIDSLDEISKKDNTGIYWIDGDEGTINLGLAHGLPSIISFLGKAFSLTRYKKAKYLGEKCVSWLLAQKTEIEEYCYFSIKIKDINNTNKDTISGSRLGWCYGDLSIAHTLISFGKNVNNNSIVEEGNLILLKTLDRKIDDKNSSINDKGFCHGTAGVYYIYKKIFESIKKNECIEDYWLNELVKDSSIESFYSYVFFDNNYKYAPDISLISGFCGIGLVLLNTIQKNQDNTWEDIFML